MLRVRARVIGLGEVARVTHLPILESLPDRFEIAALCDSSPMLLLAMGDRNRMAGTRRFPDDREPVTLPELEVIVVPSSDEYHADCAVSAMNAGKHVLIEKRMGLTLVDAERIIAARDNTNVQATAGYMRRFAPAFFDAVAEVGKRERINSIRIRDSTGRHRTFIDQSSTVIRPSDSPLVNRPTGVWCAPPSPIPRPGRSSVSLMLS